MKGLMWLLTRDRAHVDWKAEVRKEVGNYVEGMPCANQVGLDYIEECYKEFRFVEWTRYSDFFRKEFKRQMARY